MTIETLRAIARSRPLCQWALHAVWVVALLGFCTLMAITVGAPHAHIPAWVWLAVTLLALVGE